jgi:histidinol-phosphatase
MAASENDPVGTRLEWAVQIAREAGEGTLRYFRRADLRVDRKADDSPVTVADREAEQLLRARIAERFPADGIVGEEFGTTGGTSGYQWVLDPIDGTKSFIHGVPLYTTLVAVMREAGVRGSGFGAEFSEPRTLNPEPSIGVIDSPATGETVYAATGKGCSYLSARGAEPQAARVSKAPRLAESLVLTTELRTFAVGRARDAMEAFQKFERAARLTRTWGDGYGYLMVATGRAEVMIDPELDIWDLAALQPIIEEAGGTFTDWQGQPTVHSRDAVATNGLVADEVLAILRGW